MTGHETAVRDTTGPSVISRGVIGREETAAPRDGDAPVRVAGPWKGDPAAAPDGPRFWETLGRTPVVGEAVTHEGRTVHPVTFVARVPAGQEAMVHVNSLTDRHRTDVTPALLERVPGTDVAHLTYLLPPDLVASYRFVVAPAITRDVGRTRDGWLGVHRAGRPDPHCPDGLFHPHGVASSVLRMPAAPTHPAWDAARAGAPAPREVSRWETSVVGRDVVVLSTGRTARVLVLFDGPQWDAAGIAAALAHREPDDLAVVLVDNGTGDTRAGLLPHPDRVGALVAQVRDALGDRLPALRDPAAVTASGASFGGLAAAGLALTRPDLVGSAVVLSGSFQFRAGEELRRDTPHPGDLTRSLADRTSGARLHVMVGAEEDMLAHQARAFVDAATRAGAEVTFAVRSGGHDYAWWTDALFDGLDRIVS